MFRTRLVLAAAGAVAPAWIRWCRRVYRRGARPLTGAERGALGPYFSAGLLGAARVAEVDRIDLPTPVLALRLVGADPKLLPLSSPAAITLVDTIVVSTAALAELDGPRAGMESVLFHELVHLVQFRELGVRGFVRRYLDGWAGGGFDYHAIPLERQAYELQARLTLEARPFDAEAEVSRGTEIRRS
jgi:hypothetical protein